MRFSISPQALLSSDCDTGLFLAALFVKAGLEYYDSSPVYIVNERVFEQCVPALTSITSEHPYDNEFSFAIIRKSAATLESLIVEDRDSGIVKHMVYHADGQSIVYPRLKVLEILGNSDDGDKCAVEKSVAPFPVLQNLRLYASYIFADDTMFRGNGNTLEHLEMELDADTVDMLRKYNVFSKGKFPRLRSVYIQHDPDSHTRLSVEAFMQLVFGMLSAKTQILSVLAKDSYRHLVNAISACSFAENFRIFALDGTALSLLEMLNVVRLLPNMTDFTCGFKGVDPELDVELGQTIPDRLFSQYYPLNHRLKCWHMRFSSGVTSKDIAVSAIAFAVLCPRFTFVKVAINANDYNKELTDALGSGKYDKHTERIMRLFYDV
ncbi:hypothetical protein GGI22_003433 [Coemansia erecta]|nr:hypothetical protein GGI22_003433 [Coemansia erecta]